MPIPKDISLPVRLSAKERAFSQIQRWIIDGTLQPGEKLIDSELITILGVSRTPIREAFQLLEVQGFVSAHPGKDTRVTQIEKEDILKLYPTLAALHSLAAEQAAGLISNNIIEELMEKNRRFEVAIQENEPFEAMELDEHFHKTIIKAASNPYIETFSDSLQLHIRRFKFAFLKNQIGDTPLSVKEHEQIIAAMEKGDRQSAAKWMKANIIRPMNELYGDLNEGRGKDCG
ncbi:GntR family transcriptional regulator [Bacillus sp. 1P06AnD]|uniref:GntR family transcriptional regulator n=1 Tax=Bacillus sp. 1P06AnD TaxID=3132208 RepID=UPI0039A3371A